MRAFVSFQSTGDVHEHRLILIYQDLVNIEHQKGWWLELPNVDLCVKRKLMPIYLSRQDGYVWCVPIDPNADEATNRVDVAFRIRRLFSETMNLAIFGFLPADDTIIDACLRFNCRPIAKHPTKAVYLCQGK